MMDEVAQVPVAEAVDPVSAAIPQQAAGLPRGLIIASAVASGLVIASILRDGSNSRLNFQPVSG